jgi:hypothetical protein
LSSSRGPATPRAPPLLWCRVWGSSLVGVQGLGCRVYRAGGLVFKAHRLYVSLNSRLESNTKEEEGLPSGRGMPSLLGGCSIRRSPAPPPSASGRLHAPPSPLLPRQRFVLHVRARTLLSLSLSLSLFPPPFTQKHTYTVGCRVYRAGEVLDPSLEGARRVFGFAFRVQGLVLRLG